MFRGLVRLSRIPRVLLMNPWSRRMSTFLGRLFIMFRLLVSRRCRRALLLTRTLNPRHLVKFIFMRLSGRRWTSCWSHGCCRRTPLPKMVVPVGIVRKILLVMFAVMMIMILTKRPIKFQSLRPWNGGSPRVTVLRWNRLIAPTRRVKICRKMLL